jgi:hypothetical protein
MVVGLFHGNHADVGGICVVGENVDQLELQAEMRTLEMLVHQHTVAGRRLGYLSPITSQIPSRMLAQMLLL